jgi:CDP-diacylglycerol--glycerol-3-phosphate 3-phosphatidyltransferase
MNLWIHFFDNIKTVEYTLEVMNESTEFWNLPNVLTVSRIFLVPVLIVVLLTKFPEKELIGLSIFLLAAITDALDGYLARKRSQITSLGALLDPMADKLLTSAAFISLVELGMAPAWMVSIIIGREFAVTGLRSISSQRGFTMSASNLGKVKMIFQVVTIAVMIGGPKIFALIIRNGAELAKKFGVLLLWGVMLFAVISMAEYFWKFFKRYREHYFPKNNRKKRKKTKEESA